MLVCVCVCVLGGTFEIIYSQGAYADNGGEVLLRLVHKPNPFFFGFGPHIPPTTLVDKSRVFNFLSLTILAILVWVF